MVFQLRLIFYCDVVDIEPISFRCRTNDLIFALQRCLIFLKNPKDNY